MQAFLSLLLLIGAACAFHQPTQYEYQYRGVVATGIPGIRAQLSGMGIKADLVLQMKVPTHGIAQLKNIQVGQYHDDVQDVHLRNPLPINYSPMSKYAQQLEKPFAVNFAAEKDNVLEVPAHEDLWLTNVRKSVVAMLYVAPLRQEFSDRDQQEFQHQQVGQSHQMPAAFSFEEETIFGRCESDYTISPLTGHLRVKAEAESERQISRDDQKERERDEQSYYKMVRAIDFNKCHDRVILQNGGVGNMSMMGHGQFKQVHSRSSVSTYILKGDKDRKNMRVERAVVEGAVIVNPFGIETDKIQTLTNQTLLLKSVGKIESSLRLPSPTRTVRTWRYEVLSPYRKPVVSKPWVIYQNLANKDYHPLPAQYTLLGMLPDQEEFNDRMSAALALIMDAAKSMPMIPRPVPAIPPMTSINSEAGFVQAYKLFEASQIIRNLPVKQVEAMFVNVFKDKSDTFGQRVQGLLVDAVAASGASGPYKVLLEHMRNGDISDARMYSVFPTLTNNLNSPVIIPQLMKFVQTLDAKTHPYLTAGAHINFAAMVHRVCLSQGAFNYSMPNPLFGDQTCDKQTIVHEYIPYLVQKMKSASKTWERAIYIQALTRVGSEHVISPLRDVILGISERNTRLRVRAVYGLDQRMQPARLRNKIFNILMEVVDRQDEEPVIREAAFTALLTWRPSPAFWQRMAATTWRENSRQMAAFIVVTMESLSRSTDPFLQEQATYARFALRRAKPMTPSFLYSFNTIYSRYEPQNKMSTEAEIMWLQNFRAEVPTEFWASQTQSLGGRRFNWGEWGFSSEGLRLPSWVTSYVQKLLGGDQKMGSRDNEEREENREEKREEERREESEQGKQESRSSPQHVQQWIEERTRPASSEDRDQSFDAAFFFRGYDNMYGYLPLAQQPFMKAAGRDLAKLMRGHKFNVSKYYNAMQVEYFLPTELGLPLIGSVSQPSFQVHQIDAKLHYESVNHMDIAFKTNSKIITKLLSRMRVMVPWNQKQIETGVCSVSEFNFPVYGNLTLRNMYSGLNQNATLNISPFVKQEIPVMYMHNVPYTAVKSFVPTKMEEIKVITVREDKKPVVNQMYKTDPSFSGIQASASFIGDVPMPLETGKPMEYLRNPEKLMTLFVSPTAKLWQTQIIFDSAKSPVQNISISLWHMSLIEKPDSASPSHRQETQQMADLSPFDSEAERRSKLEKFMEHYVSGGAVGVQVALNGTQFWRKSEVSHMYVTKLSSTGPKKIILSQHMLMTTFCPYERKPTAICMKYAYETPNIRTIPQLVQQLRGGDLEQKILDGEVHIGTSCLSSNTVATFQGTSKMSSERKEIVAKELQGESDYDKFNPLVGFSTAAAVYDEASFQIKYEPSKIPQHIWNFTYNVQDAMRGGAYPFVSVNRFNVQNEDNTFNMHINRPLSTDRYSLFVQKPTENVLVTNVQLPELMTRVVPMSGLRDTVEHQEDTEVLFQNGDQYCYLTKNHVTTFDGVRYQFQPLPCYTTVVIDQSMDTHTQEAHFRLLVAVDTQNRWYVKAISNDQTEIVFNFYEAWKNGIKLNLKYGQWNYIENSNGKAILRIKPMDNNKHMIGTVLDESNQNHRMKLDLRREKVKFLPIDVALKNNMRGLCGDWDLKTAYDKTGPKECIYTDVQLFKYAWATQGPKSFGCDANEVEQKQRAVEQFQQTCTKRPSKHMHESIYESSSWSN